jgi:alpha-beta hydrolase superfamily lysophospholipase
MTEPDLLLFGTHGSLAVRHWPHPQPRFVALIAHGYGEHSGRYAHVAARLGAAGAAVYAPDHAGHGRSAGPQAKLELVEDMVTDLRQVATNAAGEQPGVPLVLIGHSMGGIIATRYVQRYGSDGLAALVLSGPAIGGNPAFTALLALDPIPDVPIDPAILSRDPSVGSAYLNDPLVYHGPLSRQSLEAAERLVTTIAEGPGLAELPTLWVHGEDDQLAPLAATRDAIERIRGSHLDERIYPGARHEVFNETNSDDVLDDVVNFLQVTLAGRLSLRW